MTRLTPDQHFTEPPARYSEASLVKTLEEYGIGRPSTYAPIISVIQDREYAIKEKGRFRPTPTGEAVNSMLTAHFPETVDVNFTANMENTLDAVALGAERWQDVVGAFYAPFMKNLEAKTASVAREKIAKPPPETTDEACEKCGKPMVIRTGRFGRFMACSGFPECKNTKRIEDPNAPKFPCSDCKEGLVILRRTGKGRTFWGCSRYPECKYATWTNPSGPQKKEDTAPEATNEKEETET
jgi:DNA topoisomerase-1